MMVAMVEVVYLRQKIYLKENPFVIILQRQILDALIDVWTLNPKLINLVTFQLSQRAIRQTLHIRRPLTSIQQ